MKIERKTNSITKLNNEKNVKWKKISNLKLYP